MAETRLDKSLDDLIKERGSGRQPPAAAHAAKGKAACAKPLVDLDKPLGSGRRGKGMKLGAKAGGGATLKAAPLSLAAGRARGGGPQQGKAGQQKVAAASGQQGRQRGGRDGGGAAAQGPVRQRAPLGVQSGKVEKQRGRKGQRAPLGVGAAPAPLGPKASRPAGAGRAPKMLPPGTLIRIPMPQGMAGPQMLPLLPGGPIGRPMLLPPGVVPGPGPLMAGPGPRPLLGPGPRPMAGPGPRPIGPGPGPRPIGPGPGPRPIGPGPEPRPTGPGPLAMPLLRPPPGPLMPLGAPPLGWRPPAGAADGPGPSRGPPAPTPGTLHVSNLHYDVCDKDLKELFSPMGKLLSCKVDFASDDRSLGTATVVFASMDDALTALEKFDGVAVNGQELEMKLEEPKPEQAAGPRVGPSEDARGGRGARGGVGRLLQNALVSRAPAGPVAGGVRKVVKVKGAPAAAAATGGPALARRGGQGAGATVKVRVANPAPAHAHARGQVQVSSGGRRKGAAAFFAEDAMVE